MSSAINYSENIKLQKYSLCDVPTVISIDPLGCKDIDDALSYDIINNKIGNNL
jgi:exoribonuclease R